MVASCSWLSELFMGWANTELVMDNLQSVVARRKLEHIVHVSKLCDDKSNCVVLKVIINQFNSCIAPNS